jgi:serine/threonine protein kinase
VTSGAAAGAARQSAAAPEFSLGLAGSVIKARYRVNAVSSVGRDVVLYTAEDIRNGRSIALKVLRDEFARDAAFVAAVRTQAGALAVAAHVLRGVQRVHEFDVTDTGQFFVALEWAEGATLREVLDAGGALVVPTALRVAIRVGEALEALHHNRILHGHLGPDSVLMVTDGERIRLVGAELTAAYRTPIGLRLRDAFSLAYRAPEQIQRGETTEATDVYALGMLLRELLTAGRTGQTPGALTATPPLSPAIERIITTALDAQPERRYPDISVMVNDIWGATAVLPEPESRPRSVKARGNPRRRVRQRRLPFTLRITAAAVTAGIIAAIVWVAGFDRIVSRFHDPVTPPPVTAVPVDRDAIPPSDVPSSAWATREQTPARPESRAVKDDSTAVKDDSTAVKDDSTVERRAPAVARPLPAPVIVRRPPVAPSVVGSRLRPVVESRAPAASRAPIEPPAPAERPARMERSDKDVGDGSAAIDWLLKDRR